jgi:hypothetical protein
VDSLLMQAEIVVSNKIQVENSFKCITWKRFLSNWMTIAFLQECYFAYWEKVNKVKYKPLTVIRN